jgi:hypothetical protein
MSGPFGGTTVHPSFIYAAMPNVSLGGTGTMRRSGMALFAGLGISASEQGLAWIPQRHSKDRRMSVAAGLNAATYSH